MDFHTRRLISESTRMPVFSRESRVDPFPYIRHNKSVANGLYVKMGGYMDNGRLPGIDRAKYGVKKEQRERVKICVHCQSRFHGRKNKIYCSERCRWYAFKERINNPDGEYIQCVYCGMPATTTDHVPPLSWRKFLIEEFPEEYKFMLVDCCRECNSLLGSRLIFTITERKKFLKEKIQRIYAKYLYRTKDFSEEELDEMGRTLRSQIQLSLLIKKVTLERLKWLS